MAKIHSLRQIEIVKALAKHHHFGLAAKALRVSQPALTRSLKQLEAELGVTLFDRQGVTPTPFGEIVLRHGERAAAEFHELMREVALAKGLEIGELRIAAGPYPADISGERAIGMLSARHANLADRIANRQLDQVRRRRHRRRPSISGLPTSRKPRTTPISRCCRPEAGSCCSSAAPSTRWRAGDRWRSRISWIFRGSGQASREGCAGRFPSSDKPFGKFDELQDRFHPRILVETFSAAKRIVLAGLGIGGAAATQIEPELKAGRCVTLPVVAPWFSLNYGFVTRRGRTLSPAAKAFMEIVRAIEKEIPA